MTQATNYREAYKQFIEWHPQTLQRQGPQGMTFDYLPVPAYEKHLNEVVGPENWQSDVTTSAKAVAVSLTIFGITKSSSSDIWPAAKLKRGENYVENPQPNEVTKAEARAFRRAAARHGMLADLWDKETPADNGAAEMQQRTAQQQTNRPAQPAQASRGSGGPTQPQLAWLTGKKFQVPESVARQLSGGQASRMIDAMKRYSDEDDFEKNRAGYIKQALEDVGAGHIQMVSAVKASSRSFPVYEDDDEDLD